MRRASSSACSDVSPMFASARELAVSTSRSHVDAPSSSRGAPSAIRPVHRWPRLSNRNVSAAIQLGMAHDSAGPGTSRTPIGPCRRQPTRKSHDRGAATGSGW